MFVKAALEQSYSMFLCHKFRHNIGACVNLIPLEWLHVQLRNIVKQGVFGCFCAGNSGPIFLQKKTETNLFHYLKKTQDNPFYMFPTSFE